MATNQQEEEALVHSPSNNATIINDGIVEEEPELFPPGYRFNPTDEELLLIYLKKKVMSEPLPFKEIMEKILKEEKLYKSDPKTIVDRHRKDGETEWYFFTPRDRKYRNGQRPNRAAGPGYWKATGADKQFQLDDNIVGYKKALVFYTGKAPLGDKTDWIMHEYRIKDSSKGNRMPATDTSTPATNMRLDNWVLCRLYEKPDRTKRPRPQVMADARPIKSLKASKGKSTNEFGNSTGNLKVASNASHNAISQAQKKARLAHSSQIHKAPLVDASSNHQPATSLDYRQSTMEQAGIHPRNNTSNPRVASGFERMNNFSNGINSSMMPNKRTMLVNSPQSNTGLFSNYASNANHQQVTFDYGKLKMEQPGMHPRINSSTPLASEVKSMNEFSNCIQNPVVTSTGNHNVISQVPMQTRMANCYPIHTSLPFDCASSADNQLTVPLEYGQSLIERPGMNPTNNSSTFRYLLEDSFASFQEPGVQSQLENLVNINDTDWLQYDNNNNVAHSWKAFDNFQDYSLP